MGVISERLEVEVAAIRRLRADAASRALAPRERVAIDRHFAVLLRLIAPRIRHFIRAYGLLDHRDDAGQACAIGLLRAVEMYEPERARFTTLLNWQLRGELQGLRHRLRLDARESARKVGARTLSLDALAEGGAGDRGDTWQLADDTALARVEALAAEAMARRACGRLLDAHFGELCGKALERRRGASGARGTKLATIEQHLARDRAIASAWLLGDEQEGDDATLGLDAEQRRQIARRTIRALSERVRLAGGMFGGGIQVPH